jgi:hypothetical protein
MLWATTATGFDSNGLYLDGTWVDTGNQHAFRLDGEGTVSTVPIPGSALLLFIGVFGFINGLRYRENN